MSSTSKDLKRLVRLAEQQGWRIEQRRHWVFYPPDKTMDPIVASKSPSDHRAMKDLRARLRRAGLKGA